MKPLKLLACLVTLQLTSSLTLKAADTHDFRQWTDANGRTITARLVETTGTGSVKIERQDGLSFTVPLTTFSAADQAYVKALAAQPKLQSGLKHPDAALWTLLESSGQQPASTYSNTGLDLVLEGINQRLTVRDIKARSGQPLQVRTEPSDLASRIKLSGDMPRMSMTSFMKELARTNNLLVASDSAGMVVLVDKTPPEAQSEHSFFGVKISQN
jgi:hypothetical protein